MSIRPIDIQTLLMQLSQVGRDQSVEKEGAALQAAIKSAEEQKKQGEEKEAIRRPDDQATTTEAVKDRQGKSQERHSQASESEAKGEEKASEEIVKDPSLGKHIDLTG